jgi:hypothetical protein
MAWKELREVGGIALAAIAAQVYLAVAATHPNVFPFMHRNSPIMPFINDEYMGWFGTLCFLTAVALGARQTFGESFSGTYPFLFHRPAGRRWLIGVKLLVGMTIYLICGAISILGYGLWAATPGTHASPFEWSMTADAWVLWLGMSILYLGSFLTGIRPGRWLGTRLWPFAGAITLTIAVAAMPTAGYQLRWLSAFLVWLVNVWLIGVILFVARTRDYA